MLEVTEQRPINNEYVQIHEIRNLKIVFPTLCDTTRQIHA